MSRRRWMIASLGGAAALIALWLLARALQPPPAEATPPSTSTGSAAQPLAEEAEDAPPPPTWQAVSHSDMATPERPIRSMPPSLNPFLRPLESTHLADDGQPNLRLEGIAQGASTVVLISGQRVRVGESIEGFELLHASGRRAELFAPAHGHLHLVLQGPSTPEPAEP